MKKMPNVFFITVDDLRADHTGYMGYKNITPNLDAFAKQNVFFTKAIATGPMTPLSFPSILYSLYPSEYYSQNKYGGREGIASFFKKLGYKTVAFNSNPHFKLWGFSKGFEYFEDFLYKTGKERDKIIERIKKKFVKMVGKDNFMVKSLQHFLTHLSADIALPYADAETMNKKTLEWLNQNKNQQIFCWMHYMDPHYPFFPPEEYVDINITKKDILRVNRLQRIAVHHGKLPSKEDTKILVELYDAEIKFLDKCFGEFLKELKKMDLFSNSIILFTADHGELFGDYGKFGHPHEFLYQKQLHVPLIIKSIEKKKEVFNSPVSLIDIPFAITEMLGLDTSIFNGMSLQKRKYVISEGFRIRGTSNYINEKNMIISCQRDNWKLIIDDIHNRRELYNLDDDPNESINVYGKEKEVVDELANAIKMHKRKIGEAGVLSHKIHMLKKGGKI